MKYRLVSITKATDNKHKYKVTLKDSEGKLHSVNFGAEGYSDYTKHKDPERMKRYVMRHKSREDWKISGILTAGFWSRWVLWNKPGFRESVEDTKARFNL
jgi:hypothetical protein